MSKESEAGMANDSPGAEAGMATPRENDGTIPARGFAEAEEATEVAAGMVSDWEAEAAKWKALARKREKVEERLAKFEAAEVVRANAELTELEVARNEAAAEREARLFLTRRVIASEHGLPAELAARLQGSTEEELADDARQLAELLPAKTPATPSPAAAGIGTASGTPNMDPSEAHRRLTGRN